MDALGYKQGDFIPCERTGNTGVDVHHIIGRGKGGPDRIENLMCLTRKQHLDNGDIKVMIPTLLLDHRRFLQDNNAPFDNEWFEQQLNKYQGIT